jgi:hypothetical protein
VVVALGMGLLVAQLILKSVANRAIWFRGCHFAIMNVVLASEWQFLAVRAQAKSFVPRVCVQLPHAVTGVHSVCVGLCLLAMSAANVACIRHMWRARKLQWSKRRFRLVAIHYAMLNIQVCAPGLPDLQNRCCASYRRSFGVWIVLIAVHIVAR